MQFIYADMTVRVMKFPEPSFPYRPDFISIIRRGDLINITSESSSKYNKNQYQWNNRPGYFRLAALADNGCAILIGRPPVLPAKIDSGNSDASKKNQPAKVSQMGKCICCSRRR